MHQVHAADALVGGWRLVSWENRAADDQVTYPMGANALGYLLYTGDGRFSVTISQVGRALFAAGDPTAGSARWSSRARRSRAALRAAGSAAAGRLGPARAARGP